MNPDQTAPKAKVAVYDLASYCLQYRLPNYIYKQTREQIISLEWRGER